MLDRQADFAMLAVQGPARGRSSGGWPTGSCPPRMHCCQRTVAGAPALVCGTGYTGEDGVELLLAPGDARAGLDALLEAGARRPASAPATR